MGNSILPAKRTILVVDGDDTVRCALSAMLDAAGYQVLEAASGIEALSRLGAQPVDMLICDAGMAPLSGEHVCMLVRRSARHASLPVIMLSAREGPFNSARCAMAGADHLLSKPVNDTVLLQITRAHVDTA